MKMQVLHKKFNFRGISYFSIFLVILMGLLVLLGWNYRVDFLKRPIPGLVAMNPLTAICFVGVGVSFLLIIAQNSLLQKLKLGYTLAGLVMLVSAIKLIGLSTVLSGQIDMVIFSDEIQKDAEKGLVSRMAANTAIAFIISVITLLFLNSYTKRKELATHILAIVIFGFGFFSLLGYLYGVPEFYSILSHLPMSIHTSIGFILISIAFLFVKPDTGVMKEFTSDLSGALVGKFLMFGALCVPVILGFFRINSHKMELFSVELGITLLVLSFIIIFCFLGFYIVVILNRKDALQKTAREKLEQSEERFRSIVSSVKDYAIFMLNSEGVVLTWNEGAYTIKGYTKEEIIGKNISVFYTVDDREKGLPESLLKIATEKGRLQQVGMRIRKDGTTFWADVIFTAIYDINGSVTGFVKVTRDITENREERIKMIEDIIRRNKNLEQFSYIVSHNLRAPVANIKGLCSALKIASLKEDDKNAVLNGLSLSVEKLDEIIYDLNNILNTKSEINNRKENVSFLKLVNDIKASLSSLIEKENATIDCNFSEVEEIESLKSYMHSIFYNLISNSLKYHQPGVPPRIEIESKRHNDKIEIIFKDNGLGINLEKDGEYVFGLYKRFHADKAEGKGMGLHMIKTQVENLGGRINLKSEVNKGTEFRIEI
jgi:PAS domain S-box-containing protein